MVETTISVSLESLISGDQQAFARLVDETSGHIYRVVRQIVGDEQDAEDVLQDTYLKAFRSLADFEGRSSLTTWLYRIAVNEALMLVRKRKPQTISIDDDGSNDDVENEGMEIVDWCCMPEAELLSKESKAFLNQVIQKLPPLLRAVFAMRDLEGLSIQETAEALNLTESNVKVRLLRARMNLRQELSLYFGGRLPVVEHPLANRKHADE